MLSGHLKTFGTMRMKKLIKTVEFNNGHFSLLLLGILP